LTAADSLKNQLALVRAFKQGEIYWADDSGVSQNLKSVCGWMGKNDRPIIVLEDDDRNINRSATVLIVSPLTTSSPPTTFDIPIVKGIGNIPKDSVIQVSLLFPIPKQCIRDYVGEVPIAIKNQIRKHLLKLFGFISMTA
jgi:mRNA-degrading endonuclease toxin of MazEF toxin-antitoxin module